MSAAWCLWRTLSGKHITQKKIFFSVSFHHFFLLSVSAVLAIFRLMVLLLLPLYLIRHWSRLSRMSFHGLDSMTRLYSDGQHLNFTNTRTSTQPNPAKLCYQRRRRIYFWWYCGCCYYTWLDRQYTAVEEVVLSQHHHMYAGLIHMKN